MKKKQNTDNDRSTSGAQKPGGEQGAIWHWLPLAHHPRAAAHRCVHLRLGRKRLVAVCSRCFGLYPVLVATILLEISFGTGKTAPADWWVAIGGSLPALLDWGRGRLGDQRGGNALRVVTGALLGISLGRSLACYFRDPLSELFWAQAALLVIGVLAFEIVRALRLPL